MRFPFCERLFSSDFDLPREYVSRKGAKSTTERKRFLQTQSERHFRPVKGFSNLRATFSLVKQVFILNTHFNSVNAFSRLRFRSIKTFSNLRCRFLLDKRVFVVRLFRRYDGPVLPYIYSYNSTSPTGIFAYSYQSRVSKSIHISQTRPRLSKSIHIRQSRPLASTSIHISQSQSACN